MKLISILEADSQIRPDGRTVKRLIKDSLNITVSDLQILFVTHPPNLKEDLHSHQKSYEILYFLDKANYRINNKDYAINENTIIIFEPGDVHGAIPIPHEVRILVVQVPAITDDKKYA